MRLFLDDSATSVAQASQANKGRGRIEARTATISSDVAWRQKRHQRPGLAAVGKITASRQEGSHSSVESRCYLLSQLFSPERFNQTARAHWGIENQPHWVLDVVFNEDQTGTGRKTAQTIWLCYANWRLTWPDWNPPKDP